MDIDTPVGTFVCIKKQKQNEQMNSTVVLDAAKLLTNCAVIHKDLNSN
jgi:hypothetical protein